MEYSRLLGIDYGEKRIGIASSDLLGMSAHPHPFVPNNDQKIDTISKIANELQVSKIILGLPKHLDGQESEKSIEVRAFADLLQNNVSVPIEFWDERFSTAAVERQLISADVKRKKRKEVIDSQAACFILQGYLDYLRLNPS